MRIWNVGEEFRLRVFNLDVICLEFYRNLDVDEFFCSKNGEREEKEIVGIFVFGEWEKENKWVKLI